MTKSRIISSIVFCFYIAAVAYLCFAQPDSVPQMPESWFGLPADKVCHLLMFIPFPILAFETFGYGISRPLYQILLLCILIAAGITMAVGTEYIQAHLAYRSAEKGDFLADTAGLIIGGLLTVCLIIYKRKK